MRDPGLVAFWQAVLALTALGLLAAYGGASAVCAGIAGLVVGWIVGGLRLRSPRPERDESGPEHERLP